MTPIPATNPPTSTATPSVDPRQASATLPVRGAARPVGLAVRMAPSAGGSLFVSIPGADDSVLVLLDRDGRPRPGWPIVVADSTACFLLAAVPDGSARVVCDGADLPKTDLGYSDVRAFAFDAGGALMPGWPVTFRPGTTGRVVGGALVVLSREALTDVDDRDEPDRPIADVWLTRVAADGATTSGARAQVVQGDCFVRWEVGPDGVAYGVAVPWIDADVSCAWMPPSSPIGASRISALDMDGPHAGWPVVFEGISSPTAFGPGGRILVTVGSDDDATSRVLAFDPGHQDAPLSSIELDFHAGDMRGVDCIAGTPAAPIVAGDGTIFLVSPIDAAIYALDPSLAVRPGWPLEPDAPIEFPDPYLGTDGLTCPEQAVPAAAPDGTLHLPLHARNSSVGGSLVAIASDGAVRPGWPVELRKPGAEFWAVVVGPDRTAYALAVEPEANGGSSATVLAIAPDSTVTYATTIIEP